MGANMRRLMDDIDRWAAQVFKSVPMANTRRTDLREGMTKVEERREFEKLFRTGNQSPYPDNTGKKVR